MEIEIKNKQVFPAEIIELLKAFYLVGFFEEAMLVGSWVMLLYHEAFGVRYAIRTQDIDFAVKFVSNAKSLKMDIEKIITDLGYLPVISQSGIYKYTRKNLSVEFIAHRKGGRDDEVSHIREWNITAMPLPFVDLLLRFPFTGDVGEFKVKAPLPEAFFVHKLITSQRRPDESKKDKDLEQCSVIAGHLDSERLKTIIELTKFSKKTQKLLRASCEAISFPPQKLGLK